ncbi:MAG: diaminopimelate epimerase [Calditrichaeota bacterium]|nr:diaminopimelate epimerase [Calditrichota bacterium]
MINFVKISATGNDFILIDNRNQQLLPEPGWIRRICARRTGAGADGILLLEPSDRLDFSMRYFNADGSEGELCGNGARAIAYFGRMLGLGNGERLTFMTQSGPISARVSGTYVRVSMPMAQDIDLTLQLAEAFGLTSEGFARVGVPHFVVRAHNLADVDVETIGKALRFHPHFSKGTNVNFVDFQDEHTLHIRTYERGVEAETLACGTGSAASAIVGFLKGYVRPPVTVVARGGTLTIDFDSERSSVFLSGTVTVIYSAELQLGKDA